MSCCRQLSQGTNDPSGLINQQQNLMSFFHSPCLIFLSQPARLSFCLAAELLAPSGAFLPSSPSASRPGSGRECQKPAPLPGSFMLHFSLPRDCIWQELSASSLLPSCLAELPSQPLLLPQRCLQGQTSPGSHRAVLCGTVTGRSTQTPQTGRLMPAPRRDSCKHPEWP